MLTWQPYLIPYLAAGACIVSGTRARKEVFDLSFRKHRTAGEPLWKFVVYYAVTVPVALAFWPVFLPSWFGRKKSIYDELMANPETRKLRDLFDLMTQMSAQGVDRDEIPGAQGRYGFDLSNPIPVKTIFGANSYLSRLRTSSGDSIDHNRIGSFASPASQMPVDGYELLDKDGNILGVIYLSPYHKRTSSQPPEGLLLES